MNSNSSWQPTDPQLPNRKILHLLAQEVRRLSGPSDQRARGVGWRRLGLPQIEELLAPEPAPAPPQVELAPAATNRQRRTVRRRRRHLDGSPNRRHRLIASSNPGRRATTDQGSGGGSLPAVGTASRPRPGQRQAGR